MIFTRFMAVDKSGYKGVRKHTGSGVITGSDPGYTVFSLVIMIYFSVNVLFCNR